MEKFNRALNEFNDIIKSMEMNILNNQRIKNKKYLSQLEDISVIFDEYDTMARQITKTILDENPMAEYCQTYPPINGVMLNFKNIKLLQTHYINSDYSDDLDDLEQATKRAFFIEAMRHVDSHELACERVSKALSYVRSLDMQDISQSFVCIREYENRNSRNLDFDIGFMIDCR